jgi:NitT/TauT family transport system ATP-binding protein
MSLALAKKYKEPTPVTKPSNPIIEVRGVSKVYGNDVVALDNINIAFETGHLTSLLGPSGCGKTTLLKIVAGLLQPTAGDRPWPGARLRVPGFRADALGERDGQCRLRPEDAGRAAFGA